MVSSSGVFASTLGKSVKSSTAPESVLFLLLNRETTAKLITVLTRMKCTNSVTANV